MKPFELRTLPLEQLLPADYNPRSVTAKARRKLKKSLETFGLVEPLVWNERSGRVVGGHQRLSLLKELGATEAPVSVVNLDDVQEKALNVVLNNLEAQGRYDPAKLADVLRDLAPLPELEASGFDERTLGSLEFVPTLQPIEQPSADAVEITLTAGRTTYGAFAPRLDQLVREFDLIVHVREASASARPCSPTRAAASNPP